VRSVRGGSFYLLLVDNYFCSCLGAERVRAWVVQCLVQTVLLSSTILDTLMQCCTCFNVLLLDTRSCSWYKRLLLLQAYVTRSHQPSGWSMRRWWRWRVDRIDVRRRRRR
jgi:hypothetical protein